MRMATIVFAAMTVLAVPAAADEDAVFEALKLETNTWEMLADALYFIAISNPDEKPKALARYEDDTADFLRYMASLKNRISDEEHTEMLESIATDWQAMKEMIDALIEDASTNVGGALFDEKLRAVWQKAIVVEDQIEILAEALRS